MSDSAHWLEGVLEKAGEKTGGVVSLPSSLSLADAWQRASEATGVHQSELADLVALFFHLPRADLTEVESKALKLVPEGLAQQYQMLPLREDYRRLVVATADPTNLEAEQAVGFASGRGISLVVASCSELEEALLSHYSPDKDVARILFQVQPDLDESLDDFLLIEEEDDPTPSLEAAGSGPLVELTNVILKEAVESGASDIHLQPMAHGGVIRYRIDGVLRNSGNMPLSVLTRVVSRIKIMARLDIADRLRPQDGRAKVAFGDRKIDLRISTVPTRSAEKMVIRILDSEEAKTLEEVGFQEPELSHFRHLLTHREGIVVVTGPTGSGKTTSLYAALQHIHDENVNIMTVEDPVEYELPGLTQIQVETKQGVTFASAFRAILRQDPDIVFVGEIRDLETAQIAAQAALTGHLVLSTLHTNNAVGTVGRFIDMGLDRPTLADTLRGALAQRLVRRVCPLCSVPVDGELSEAEARLADEYGVKSVVRPVGCGGCGKTGYRGRLPLVEVLTITPKIKELIFSGASAAELRNAAMDEGVRSLREVGVARVRAGETTLQELERVLGDVGGKTEATEEDSSPPSAESQPASAPTLTADAEEEMDVAPPILIVDDDGANRTIAKALLESENHRVVEAKDGVEALEQLQSGAAFSLVVLDLEMPRLGGREVLKEIRGSLATVGLPVIVLTGSTDPEAEITLMEEGADDYIRKPFDPRRFMIRVKAALRRAGG
jgi:type II secretory ATPase GspE/PulE/Tfp pilus assembly ATPase PilB-like protein/ActR/RegA family two-component response regulator